MKYLKKFNTENDRSAYENGESYIEPYVSYVDGGDVHYNKPPFFCKLTLSNGDVVELEGSGELAASYINPYRGSGITSAEIGTLCTSIGAAALGYTYTLSSITIPNSVTSIGDSALRRCSGLTSITIPNGVTSIGTNSFNGCNSLTNIVIPNSVTTIGNYAFDNCYSNTSITIGSAVTSIGENAFSSNLNLQTITSFATIAPTIGSYTFEGAKNGGTLYVPSGSTGYDVWMQNANYYLGLYDWTKVEQ